MKIVQIGAGHGFDHVSKLIEGKDVDMLILVEPNPLNIPKLRECYKDINNVIIDDVAIGLVDDVVQKLYYSTNNLPDYQFASFIIEHILKHGLSMDSIKHFDVFCKTLTTFLDSHNVYDLDYLFLDIEGIDAEVVLSFNPSKFNIKNIQLEHLHLGDNKDNVYNHLISHGYEISDSVDFYGFDVLFTKTIV